LEILFWNAQKGPFMLRDLGNRHLRKFTQIQESFHSLPKKTKTKNQKPKTKNQKPKTKHQKPKNQISNPKKK